MLINKNLVRDIRLAINEYDDNYDEDNAEVCIEVIRRLIEQEEFWWYRILERLLKRPIGEIIENSIVEVIGNIYENSELLESVEEWMNMNR